jgi:hypothetical protein
MKLTSVELHPKNSSEVAVLSFRDPRRANPYNVKAITGLDADEIVPRYYGGSLGSEKFHNLSLKKRTIVVRIGLNPSFANGKSFSDLRDAIYKVIHSSRTGTLGLQFKNGANVIAAISGFVTKLEAPLFNKEPEVQITVQCDEPMLKAPARINVDVTGLSTANAVITDDISTAPHGFLFTANVLANTASMTIVDPDDLTWALEVIPPGGFLLGDVIHFSSELNNKYLYLVRGGSTYYLADVIVPSSVWPIFFPGENKLQISPSIKFAWASIEHYPTYWGV